MVHAFLDFSVALPVAVVLLIGAGVLARLAAVIHRKDNPPTDAIRRRSLAASGWEEDTEVR